MYHHSTTVPYQGKLAEPACPCTGTHTALAGSAVQGNSCFLREGRSMRTWCVQLHPTWRIPCHMHLSWCHIWTALQEFGAIWAILVLYVQQLLIKWKLRISWLIITTCIRMKTFKNHFKIKMFKFQKSKFYHTPNKVKISPGYSKIQPKNTYLSHISTLMYVF
jgi:hypothetical protein